MKRLEFDEKNNLADVLNAIKNEADAQIEIFIFPGSEILKDSANREVLELLAKQSGKEITIKGNETVGPKISEKVEAKEQPKENLGFVEGEDIAEKEPGQVEEAPKKKFKLPLSIPKLPKLGFLKGKRWIYFAGGFLILAIVGLVSFFWFVPSADITLSTEKKFQESELSLVASAQAEEIDAKKGIIPLKTLEITKEDVVEKDATGTKTVGTNAKGRVKIINRDTKEKKFFAGTEIKTITGGKSLSFTLDDVATVSAAPVACTNDCSETAVNVTAKAIGEDSNVKTGTKFQVGSVTDTTKVVAEGLINFAGGSSKKITVVSGDDQKKAKDELLKKIEKEAKEELEKENPGITIPEGGLETEILNESYSKTVGSEAKDFRLSLEVKFIAKVFSEEDLKELLTKSISESIPSGFEVDKETSTVTSEILEKTDKDLKVLGKIAASLIPKVNEAEVARNIAGKDFGTTDKYLKSLNSISGFEIKLEPSFFRIFGTMPLSGGRIKINVVQKE